jgi:hypothetical protein
MLMETVAGQLIGCGIHFPMPVHLQEKNRFLVYGQGSFRAQRPAP